ncbi:class I SAM-dependent methyltransferase [Streptomyces capillispiralis]|uniref:Methyltransferase family protein n=1 Tax=Streptomyces capillispiralis TaxID=68182 RepID=A0A561T992_9ACTN|nr:class I SAM-dependent methyltransferase [Streptomyces capillispiralis]TWF83679.1 methyltransferase family protein [Streptomyces capillispiralis]GHH91527.1 methyltransferase type 12 [Streptomyces capillispiralis]
MSDPYERSAEYLDILIAEAWDALGPALADVLARVRATTGTVVDLGAGSGRGVRVIRDALPGAPVLAVEPSAAMRAVLLARVHEDAELRRRVTVVPDDCAGAEWPDGVRAVVALNMVGHLPPGQRRALWGRAAHQLAPGGALVFNITPPFAPVEVERVRMAGAVIGEMEYEGWASARPTGADEITWRMEYGVLRRGRSLGRASVEYRWWVATEEALAAEAAEAGLALRRAGDPALGLCVLERADTTSSHIG